MDTCLHVKRKAKTVEKGGGSHSTRQAGRHMVSYHLGQVGGAPPRPYKYPPPVEIGRHTPLIGNFTYKALILSVLARCSLVGRVAKL
jgi:hypothetical protein